jgi:hypothetical protein
MVRRPSKKNGKKVPTKGTATALQPQATAPTVVETKALTTTEKKDLLIIKEEIDKLNSEVLVLERKKHKFHLMLDNKDKEFFDKGIEIAESRGIDIKDKSQRWQMNYGKLELQRIE